MAAEAWKAAAQKAGWTVESEGGTGGSLRTTLKKPGSRVLLKTRRNGRWLIADLRREELELVQSSWPTDPFCPENTRPRPADRKSGWDEERRCYLVDSELIEHGPYERREDGEVVQRGQYANGERVGTWTERYELSRPHEVFERIDVYGPDGGARTYRQGGRDVAHFPLNAKRMGEGTWTWWSVDGDVSQTVEMRNGRPIDLVLDLQGPTTPILWKDAVEFEILDARVEQGLVAYKTWPRASDAMETPVDCAYPGMKDRPDRGVELGAIHVDTGEVETWEVYRSALEASSCMRHEDSGKALAAAKERFAALGLSTDRRPALVLPKQVAPRSVRLEVGGRTVAMDVHNDHGDPSPRDIYGQVFDSSDYSGYVLATWQIDGDAQPPMGFSYGRSGGGGGNIALVGGLESGDQALLLVRADYQPVNSQWGFLRVKGE